MISPYAYKERQWCGYDDVQSVETKVELHYQKYMIWPRMVYSGYSVCITYITIFAHLSKIHISIQASYIVSLGLAGAMVWSIETDDFHGNCHAGPFPLITTIRTVLRDGKPIPTPTPPPTPTPTPEPETTTVRTRSCIHLRIITWPYALLSTCSK